MSHNKIRIGIVMMVVGLLSFAVGTIAQPRYPDIDQAEGHLNAALGGLHAARDVFGGHKANAEGLIRQAIGELENGKAFAASHGY